jgi:hypothetical protein
MLSGVGKKLERINVPPPPRVKGRLTVDRVHDLSKGVGSTTWSLSILIDCTRTTRTYRTSKIGCTTTYASHGRQGTKTSNWEAMLAWSVKHGLFNLRRKSSQPRWPVWALVTSCTGITWLRFACRG